MQPPLYEREYNFAKDNGSNSNHAELNRELGKIAVAINRLREQLAKIQADDDSLHDWIIEMIVDYIGDGEKVLAEAKEKWREILELLLKAQTDLDEAERLLAQITALNPVQPDWNETDANALAYIKNKPTDLITASNLLQALNNISTQIQSDWAQTNTAALDFIKNKPTLSKVATSGNYDDLNGKPSLSAVATSGNYDDLSGKPTKLSDFQNDIGAGGGVSSSSGGNYLIVGDVQICWGWAEASGYFSREFASPPFVLFTGGVVQSVTTKWFSCRTAAESASSDYGGSYIAIGAAT